MEKLFKPLQTLVAVALCAVMAVAFTACSDDDDPSDLASTIVGVWEQNGDDDILVIESGGTGTSYASSYAYNHKIDPRPIQWSVDGSWFTIKIDGDKSKTRAVSISKNKIVFRDYEEDPINIEIGIELGGYEKDEFGYYTIWTWHRYDI